MPTESRELHQADEWMAKHPCLVEDSVEHWLKTCEWLTLLQLGRGAMRRGEEDAFDALRELPAPLGRINPPGDHVVLRIRAMAAVPNTAHLLDGYVRVLQFGYKTLRDSSDERPSIKSSAVQEELGATDDEMLRLSQLVLAEDWMFAGGGGSPGQEWHRWVDDGILAIRDVRTIDEYLAREAARFWAPSSEPPHWVPIETPLETIMLNVPRRREFQSRVLASPPARADVEGRPPLARDPTPSTRTLHTLVVTKKTAKLLADHHFDEAIRDAALNLRDLLRETTGRQDLDGSNLVDVAFAGAVPLIQLADLTTADGKREQDGWHKLASGCVAVMRNPVAHRNAFTDSAVTFEALATMSLIARQIDAAIGAVTDAAREEADEDDASS